MKEGGGGDHVSVGIRFPRTGRVKPISKKDLYRRRPGRKNIVAIAFVVIVVLFSAHRLSKTGNASYSLF